MRKNILIQLSEIVILTLNFKITHFVFKTKEEKLKGEIIQFVFAFFIYITILLVEY